MGAEAASSPAYAGRSVYVPAAPVWELVRRRQLAWGLSDDEMCDVLDWHPRIVDDRPNAPILRPTAEKLLRRLAAPRRLSDRTAL
jgi:hypothetical protein